MAADAGFVHRNTNKVARQNIGSTRITLQSFQPRDTRVPFATISVKPLASLKLRGISIETVAHRKSLSVGIQVRHLIRSGPPGR